MSNFAAVIKSLIGQVFVTSVDGLKRQVFEGDRIFAGELVTTADGGSVTLEMANGETVQLGANSSWQAGNPETQDGSESTAQAPLSEFEQALAAGLDPTVGLEPTAAGPGAGGGGGAAGGGHSTVMLNETAQRVDPTIGFQTNGLGTPGFNLIEDNDPAIFSTTDATGVGANTPPDTTAPVVTIGIDPITSDDILNSAELGATTVTITGTVGGEAKVGDAITLNLGGSAYSGTVIALGNGTLGFSIQVSSADLGGFSSISATVSSADAAGNVGTATASRPYTVDTTAPVITVDAPAITNDTTPTISGTTDAPLGSTVTLTVTQGTNTFTVSTPVLAGGTYTVELPQPLAEGPYTIGAQVTDPAGNTSTATDSGAIDTTAPAITVDAPTITNDTTPTISGTTDAPVGSTITLTITQGTTVLTSTATVVAGGTYSTDVPAGLVEGSYSVNATVTDAAGNTGSAIDSGAIDTTAPAVTVDAPAVGNDTTPSITGTTDAPVGSTVTLTITQGTTVIIVNTPVLAGGTYTVELPQPLAEGPYTVGAQVTDPAGNTGSATDSGAIDTTAPAITVDAPAITNDTTPTITGTTDAPVGSIVTLTITQGTTVLTTTATVVAGGTYSANVPAGLVEGPYSVDASVTDAAGNTGSATDSGAIDTTAPVITVDAPAITNDTSPTISGTTDAPVGSTVTLTITQGTNVITVTTPVLAGGTYSTDIPAGLVEGSYSVNATVTDAAGNTGSATDSGAIDTTAPAITIDAPAITNDTTPTITGTTDAPVGSTVTLTITQGTTVLTTTAIVVAGGTYSADVPAGLVEGSYSADAKVTDAAGNTGSATDSGAIDTTAPAITVDAPAITNDTTPTITGTTDAPVGSTVTLTITQGTNVITVTTPVLAGGTYTVDVPQALAEGPYTVGAQITDPAGNTGSATDSGAIDTTAPAITVDAPAITNDTTPTITGTTDAPVGSTVTLTITQGTTVLTTTATVLAGGTYSTNVPAGLIEGSYSVNATVTDAAGNTGSATDSGAIDTTAPAITVDAPAITNDTTPSITGTTDAPVGSTVTLTITQGTNVITVTTPVLAGGTYTVDIPQALTEGPYTVGAQITDAAGNTGSATDSGAIDTTAPAITVDAPAITNDSTPTITGTTDAPVGSTVTLTITQGTTVLTTTAIVVVGGTYSADVPAGLAEGSYSVNATVTDAAGNTGLATDSGAIDTTAPAITIDAPAITNDTTPTITGTTDAPVGSTVTLTITQGSTVITVTTPVLAGGAYTVDVPQALTEGPYTVGAQVTDPAGNTGSATDSGAIDTTAPAITVDAPAITNDATPTITGTTDAPVGSTVTLTITQGTNVITVTTPVLAGGTYTVNVPQALAEGPYTVGAQVTDPAGNTGSATDSGAIDTTAPAITVDAPAITNDTTPTITGTTDAPVGSTVTLTITQGTTVTTVSTPVLAGGTYTVDVPQALAEGPYTVGAQITDAAGNTGSATDSGAIDTTAPTITVDAPAITNDTTPTITGTTDAPVGSTVTLTITQGSTVLTTTAVVVAGGTYSADVPAGLAEGSYSVDAKVTDAAGNTGSATDSGAINTTAPLITVDAPAITNDTTPTITGTTDAPVGSTVTLTITQGTTVLTTAATVVAGGTYSADVPVGLVEGSYSVDAKVTDAAGNTGSATDSGAIDTTAPAITVDAPAITNDTTPSITGTTDAPVGSTVTLTITQGTNVITVTTPVLAGGTYTVDMPQALAEGPYTVGAQVTDPAGNTGSATDSGAIDTTAPVITVDAPAVTNDTTPSITGTTDAPVGSTVTLTITQGTNVITVTTPVLAGGTYTVDVPQALAEGPYTVGAQVTDPAGNTGTATDSGAIDTTAPAITVDAPAITNDTTPTITGTTDAPVGSIVTLTITHGTTVLTTTAIVVAGGSYSADVPAGLAEGSYSVDAKVTDAAGNTGSATDSGAIDTTAPAITVDAPAITNDTTPSITGTTDAPVGSTVTLTITQGSTVLTTTATVVAGGTYSADVPAGLVEGSYSVNATVTDAAGNNGSATDSGAIDTTAPAITVDAPAITNDTTPTITGTTDAPVGSTVTLTITQGNNVITVSTPVLAGGIYTVDVPQALAEGPYTVGAQVTDPAGNIGSATDSGAIDTTAPVITVDAPAITNDPTPTITGTTDAPVGSTVTLTITQGSVTFTVNTPVLAGGTYAVELNQPLAEGPYSVDATVTDAAGNTGSATDSGAIDTTAPAITVDAPAITNDTTPTITGTTDAPVGSIVTLTITHGTTVLTTTAIVVAGGTYSADVPAGLAEGSYSVDAKVTDAAGNTGSATDSGAIDTTAPLINVDVPAITNDTTPTISGTTDAPVGSTVTLTITQGTTVLTTTAIIVVGGTYSADVPAGLVEGSYSVDAKVTDAAGNTGSATDSGAIDTTAPAITVDAPAITNDTTPTITGTTDAPVGSTVTLTITQGSTVITVTTPVLAGGTYTVDVPQALAEGPYTVGAEVTDPAGNTGTATDDGAINTTAPAITVDAPATTNDTTPTITGTTDAPVGSTVTLTITQGTTVFNVTTPVLAGGTYSVDVPKTLGEGPYSVDAEVTDAAGNTGSATDSGTIDTTAPSITVDAPAITNDTTPTITGTTDAPVGSTVTLTITQGTNVITVTTPVLAGSTYAVDVPQALAEGSYTVVAQVSDQAGNIGSATDSGAVDVTAPVPTITLDANITADDVINIAESGQQIPVTGTVGGDAKVGDTVTLTVNGTTFTGLVTNTNGTLGFSINVPGADLVANAGQTISASISTTDAAGNVGTATDTEGYNVDTTAPVPTITLDANITADDVINSTEAGQQIPVTGTVGGDAKVGDTVTLTVNGTTFTGLVTNTNGTLGFSINVPGADLVANAGQTISASISTTDAAGNVGTATDTEGYSVDTTAPTISVDAPAISNDTTPTITGTTDAPVGSTVTLTITQGTTVTTVTTPVLTGGTYTVDVPHALADGPYTVDAQVTDPAGNTGSATDNGAIDTLAGDTGAAPVVTITEDVNNDGVISRSELNGPIDVRVSLPAGAVAGDTLVITNGTTPQTVTLTAAQITAGFVTTTFPSPGEGNTLTVEATLQDQFGNTSDKGSDTARVDTLAGTTGAAPVVTITEDVNNDGVISKSELNGPIDVRVGLPAGAVTGDTLVITNGTTPQTVTLTAAQITAGFITTSFPSPGEGNTLTVEATLQDQFGNTSEKGTDTARVDTLAGTTGAAPVVTITEDVNNDGVISKSELNGPIDVRVGLPAGAVTGDTLVITNGTTPQTVTLTAAQITAGFITTSFPSPGEGNTLTVEATLQDQFGNTSEKGTDTARVDTLAGTTGAAPVVTITEDVNNDGVISKSELNGPIDVRVGLPAGAVTGDTLVITNGTTPQTVTLTAAQITAGFVTTTFANPGEGNSITVEATLRDQFGNTSEKGTDTAKVDTLAGTTGAAPVVTITEDANNDGVISKSELNGEIDVRVGLPAGAVAGDTLVITNGTTPQTVTLTAAQITAGFVTTTFPSPGEGNTLTVEATLQDQFGNTSNKGTDSARVDTLAGATGAAPTVEIREDINNDGVIGQNELSGAIDVRVGLPAGSVAGDTISVTDGTTIKTFTLTTAQITTGHVDTTFANPGEGKTITVEATLQDQFGNTSGKGSDQALVNSNPVAVDDPVGSPYTVTIGDLVSGSATNNWANNDSNNQQTLIQARDGNGDSATLLQLAVDGNQNALGVAGSPRAVLNQVPDQLEYDPTTGKTESITLNFSGNLNQADFRVSRLIAAEEGGEVGRWVAMYEGVEVASGTFKFSGGGSGTFSLDTGTQVFDSIRFEALPTANGAGDGSDYFLTGFSGSGPASANSAYVVNESQTLVIDQGKGLLNNDSDAQANQTLGVIKINGADVPADGKVALATGVLTVNADGSFNFAANDNNLKSGEIKTQNFTYTVSDGYGGTATATATITIIGTEVAPGIGAVSAAVDSTGGQVDEGDNAVFTVSLTNASSTASTFNLSINPGTANAGSDYNAALTNQNFSNGVTYNATTGQVTVPGGVTSFTVSVPTINDTVSEPSENFSLTVGGKTGTATIIDNDAAPTVGSVSAAVDSAGGQVDEGDNAVFTVNLTNASSTPTTFSLALNAGTATAGSDYNGTLTNQSFSNGVTYNAATGQVTVPAGVTSFTVTVPTINDTVSEPSENFSLTVGGKTGTATIIDNDAAPSVGSVSAAVDSTGGQVDEGDNAVFTVNLSNASSTPTTLSLALNAGTATAGSDYNAALTNQSFSNGVTYNAATGQITVPAGVTSFTVSVPTLNDTVHEQTETFSLTVGGQTGTATIIDNDAAPTVSTVSAAVDSTGGQVDEGDNAVFTVNLTNASSTATSFSLALNPGSALPGFDYNAALTNQSFSNGVTYNALTGVVAVPAGVTSFTVTVPTINDTVAEPTETFTLTVGGKTGTATIIDNDAAPTVSTVSAAVDSTGGQVDEGDNAVFTVNLSNAGSTPTTFSLALNPGTATAGSDYNAALNNQSFSNGVVYNAITGQVTVPAGVTSFTVTVPTINDTVSEPTETFSLSVGGKTGTATIIDNDAAPTVSTVSAAVDSTGGQVDEGDSAVFTVNLTNASSTPTTFSLALNAGTATAGSDYNGTLTNQSFSNGVTYNAATGQVTVPAGVTSFTVTVPTINDTVSEPTESFTLTVGGQTGTATIIDNDAPPTVGSVSAAVDSTGGQVDEGDNAVFTVNLTNASSTPTTFSLALTPGTAVAGSDYNAALTNQSFSNGVTYNAATGQVTVPAGVTSFTVTVPTINDTVSEPTETFTLNVGGKIGTATIIDNDPVPTVKTIDVGQPGTADDNVVEGNNLVFNVTLSNASSTPTVLAFNATGTATANVDYKLTAQSFSNGVTYDASTGKITVPAGVTTFSVTVQTLADNVVAEPLETVKLDIGGLSATGGIIDGTPDAKDDSYTRITGLKAEYYGYNDASTGAGNDGANLTNLSQVRQFIDSHNPAATFNATKLDYGTLSNASGLGNGTNLQNFLGVDVASGNGAKANSLSTDPGNTSDAIIKMGGYINLAAGTYQFKVTADDGYSIRINGQVVAEFNNIQSTSTATGQTFTISAAQAGAQQIEIIYWDQGGDARLKVELGQGGTFKVVDSDMLYHVPSTSSLVVESGDSLTIAGSTLLGNDTDPNGDALSITSVQNATNGTVTLNNGNVVFTPKAGFYGDASFQYTVNDGKGGSDIATVTLKVNQPADTIRVAGSGANDNGDNTIGGGAGNDVLLGDAGGTLTTLQPATNYNIALLVDTSGSMQGDRMSLTKSALSNFAKTLAGHDGVVNLTLVGFAGDVTLSTKVADLQNGSKLDNLLADIQRLTANGGTNYEAAFKEASAWFDAQSAAGNTKAAGYENLTFFLSDGDPTFYYNGNTTTVSGNGSTTNDQVLLGSLDTFNVLAGKSAVQAIGIGSGVSQKNLSLFDNTTDAPASTYLANGSAATLANFDNNTTGWNNLTNWQTSGTGTFNGSVGRSGDALMIRDTVGGSPVTATTPSLTIADGAFSSLRFAYGTTDTGNGDALSWKLQQLVQGVWTDVQTGGGTTGGNWTTAETAVVGAGTYRLAFSVDDKSSNFASATMAIDNITRVDYTKVPVGKVEIVNSADELSVALHGGSNANVPVTVGNDTISGGDGNDIIFGDVINTDGLKWGVDGNPTRPADLHDGAGVKALETFLELKNGIAPSNGDLYDYIRANHETFNVAGDTRGGADKLYGGGGNDILYGQGGNDLLVGGAGDDILFGGAGADTFAWQKGDFGKDVIKDFNVAEGDTIDLSSLLQDHSNNLDSYLKLVTDNGSSTLLISTKGEFNTADTSSQQVAAKADVQIDLGQASLPSYDINTLIANHTIKVDP
ncbi:Ig-like domain-containing protein [Pseudomonas sp. MGal98]|uniref:Ig-like domain-containing protein n=1 Tax=Pseudomonas sp. MGal98 TaxID=3162460 RepID=UPI0032ECA3BC